MESAWPFLALTLISIATVDARFFGHYNEFPLARAVRGRGLVGDVMGGLVNTKASYIEEWRRPRGLVGDIFAGAVNTKGSYQELNTRPRGLVGDVFLGLINTKLSYLEQWLQGHGEDDKIKQLYELGGDLSLHLADLVSQVLEALFSEILVGDDEKPQI